VSVTVTVAYRRTGYFFSGGGLESSLPEKNISISPEKVIKCYAESVYIVDNRVSLKIASPGSSSRWTE